MDIGIIGSRGYPLVYSGYETLVSELAPALAARGHRVTVYCHSSRFAERPKELNGVQLEYVNGASGKNLNQLSHSALSTFRARKNDHSVILFVNVANGPFVGLLRLLGIPTAINVDGLEWDRPKWSRLGREFFAKAARIAARTATTVITDADEMRAVYERRFGTPSTVIAYGAPTGIVPDLSTLDDWDLEAGKYVVVMGRLIKDNNGDLIAREFVRSRSEYRLVILGDVPYKRDPFAESIRREFEDADVTFTGYVSEPGRVEALLQNSAAYIHGHEFGGTNPSLVWAMASGCRILALDTPFSREVLLNGACGELFTKSPDSLASILRGLADTDVAARAMAEAARHRALTHYSWDRIVDQYEECLHMTEAKVAT